MYENIKSEEKCFDKKANKPVKMVIGELLELIFQL